MTDIFILANGLGQRFQSEGFLYPKPLIKVFGQPLIFYSIRELFLCKNQNFKLTIPYNKFLNHFEFKNLIEFEFKDKNIDFLELTDTSGPADTVYQTLKKLKIKNGPFLTIDCDIVFSNLDIENFLNNPRNLIFYFIDKSPNPIFSYIKEQNENVTDIIEKVKISDLAGSGIHGYQNASTFIKIFEEKCLNKKIDKEPCPSTIYKEIINQKIEKVFCRKNYKYHCLGTPELLKKYCLHNEPLQKKRFCFDIDNTIFKLSKNKNYSDPQIIDKNIKIIQNLYQKGHTIILFSARNMASFNNNMGLINKHTAPILIQTLEKFNVPYHEIYFNKPVADFYIDDLAVNAFDNIEENIGFYFDD